MKKITPSIIIWHLELIDEEYESVQSLYFLTKRGVERFLKIHEKEIDEQKLKWCCGGEQLWLW